MTAAHNRHVAMISPAQPDFKSHFTELLRQSLSEMSPPSVGVNIEFARPRQANHGDYACNLAMQLAKPLRKNPREIAALLANALSASPYLEKIKLIPKKLLFPIYLTGLIFVLLAYIPSGNYIYVSVFVS